MRLAGPAGRDRAPRRRQPERDHSADRLDRRAALGAAIERRHQPQLAQASQLEPQDPPRPQVSVAQMPQGDPRRVEQPGVRVVEVGQIGQQLGDVVAGIQGRQIAAKRCEALDRHGLGQQVERLGRLGKQHDIGNAQQVKSTLERRLEPPCPLGQHRDLPQLAGEQGRDQAGLEDLDRPQHQGQSSDCGHFSSTLRRRPVRPTRRATRSRRLWPTQGRTRLDAEQFRSCTDLSASSMTSRRIVWSETSMTVNATPERSDLSPLSGSRPSSWNARPPTV